MNTAVFLLSKITTGNMSSSTTIKKEQDVDGWSGTIFPQVLLLVAMEAKFAVEK